MQYKSGIPVSMCERGCTIVSVRCIFWISLWSIVQGVMINSECPRSCVCSNDRRIVKCDNVTSVPQGLPSQVQELRIEGTNMTSIGDSFRNLTHLTKLFLNNNQLNNVSAAELQPLINLHVLDLSHNRLESDVLHSIQGLRSLRELNLGYNRLKLFHTEAIANLDQLVSLNLQGNRLHAMSRSPPIENRQLNNTSVFYSLNKAVNNSKTLFESKLQNLDLSFNNFSEIISETFVALPWLQTLSLSNNAIIHMELASFTPINFLRFLDLSGNDFKTVPGSLFIKNTKLQDLRLSHMPALSYVNHKTFEGLSNLHHLDLSHNNLFYIHENTFHTLIALETLDLRHNSLTYLSENVLQNLTSLQSMMLQGNPWICDCNLHWLIAKLNNESNQTSQVFHINETKCAQPEKFSNRFMRDIDPVNLTCTAAQVINHTQAPFFKVGSSATLDCNVAGNPRPKIMWVTPRKQVLTHSPHRVQHDKRLPFEEGYKSELQNYNRFMYEEFQSISHKDRIHLLHNGSLFIDYVMRNDGGVYTCLALNNYGNDTATMKFKLDYLILFKIRAMSILFGLSNAFAFFFITVTIWVIRYVVHKCSKEQRQKRKSIRQIIGNLDAYKTVQLDKLRNYKNITVGTLLTQVEKMRENYVSQVAKIKDNCTQHMERVRDNYSTQMSKFKDYGSHQIERICENYHHQLVKTREYGNLQLEKLREQYKLQQQHLFKLLEIMNLTNCRGVVEAECLKTESMLFDDNLILGLDPPYTLHHIKETCSYSSNEYITASSNNSSSLSINRREDIDDMQTRECNTNDNGTACDDAQKPQDTTELSMQMVTAPDIHHEHNDEQQCNNQNDTLQP